VWGVGTGGYREGSWDKSRAGGSQLGQEGTFLRPAEFGFLGRGSGTETPSFYSPCGSVSAIYIRKFGRRGQREGETGASGQLRKVETKKPEREKVTALGAKNLGKGGGTEETVRGKAQRGDPTRRSLSNII